MIDGTEQIHPTTDSNYINNSDDHPTVGVWGGITLKQHMVIEFSKSGFEQLPQNIQATICEEDAPYMEIEDFEGGKTRYPTYGEPYVQWLIRGKVKYAIMQANEVIKQLNDEDK